MSARPTTQSMAEASMRRRPSIKPNVTDRSPYPSINEYALIGDGHAVALVSRDGSIDWCCMPRMDHGSCFGRILDWEHGGHCSLTPVAGDLRSTRRYLDETLVLETRYAGDSGAARVLDCFTVNVDDERISRA